MVHVCLEIEMKSRPVIVCSLIILLATVSAWHVAAADNTTTDTRSDSRLVLPIEATRVAPEAISAQRVVIEQRVNNQSHLIRSIGPQLASRKHGRFFLLTSGGNTRAISKAAMPETLKVLLVRIAFENDVSGSLTSVTTDGNFLLTPDPAAFINRPPHDKPYFESHFSAMVEYWHSMSNGLLTVEYQVVPEGLQDAYMLSDMADYGPGSGGTWDLLSLERLVTDMVLVADTGTQADGSANLADYDDDNPATCIIFVHPGADWQSNLEWDPAEPDYSPNDIPSFWATLDNGIDLSSYDSGTGALGLVSEMAVIPETTSQDGAFGGIASLLANQVGHALGLPDLFDTATGLPAVGIWDLMGSGMNVPISVGYYDDGNIITETWTGLFPPSIGIWSKNHLGWVEVDVVEAESRDVELLTAHLPAEPTDGYKAVAVVLPGEEHLLLENRWVPARGDGLFFETNPTTGVIQYLANSDGSNSHLYDFFLPTAGLLVWHVHQDLVDLRLATNTLQRGVDRAVKLIEADGIQNIGIGNPGETGYFGRFDDAFRDGSSDFVATATFLTGSYGVSGALITGIPGSSGLPMVFHVGATPAGVGDLPGGWERMNGLFLDQNFPNPFNPTTTLSFETAIPGNVRLQIHDTAGRLVVTIMDEYRVAGRYDMGWDGRDQSGRHVPSGVYFYSLDTGDFVETKRMILVR